MDAGNFIPDADPDFTTNPDVADTDGGSVPDGEELQDGSDPLDPSDDVPEDELPIGETKGGGGLSCATGPQAPALGLVALIALALRRRR